MNPYYSNKVDFNTDTGTITAKEAGVAWVEMGSNNKSGLKKEFKATVVDKNGPIELTGLSVAPKTLTVNKDQYLGYFGNNIAINYEPGNTSEKSVKFISN